MPIRHKRKISTVRRISPGNWWSLQHGTLLRFKWTGYWAIISKPWFPPKKLDQMISEVPSNLVLYDSVILASSYDPLSGQSLGQAREARRSSMSWASPPLHLCPSFLLQGDHEWNEGCLNHFLTIPKRCRQCSQLSPTSQGWRMAEQPLFQSELLPKLEQDADPAQNSSSFSSPPLYFFLVCFFDFGVERRPR